jgi:hypothetical protein
VSKAVSVFTVVIASLLTTAAAPPPVSSPAPAATPKPLSSFSAPGWLTVRAAAREKVATLKAVIRLERLGALTRIDLGDVSATADNGKGAVTQPFPAGAITAVLDQGRRLFSVWSSRSPIYYESKLTLSTSSAATAVNEMSALTKYQLLSFALNLTGRQLVDGHVASTFAFESKAQKHGGKVQNAAGHVALADGLAGMPIHADLTLGAGAPSTVTLQLDFTSISTNAPPLPEFTRPPGYKRTTNPLAVLVTMAPQPAAKP